MNDTAVTSDLTDTGLDGYAPYLMNRIMERYNAQLRSEMAAIGLTTAKMRALAVLAVETAPTISALAEFAAVELSTLSRALDGLEGDGFVRRKTDDGDQRSSRIHLTDAGRAAFDRLWPHMRAAHDSMFDGIDADEHATLLRTLAKMLANVRQHEI